MCHKLNERIAIELDGRAIELPELEGIVLLNIGSWSSGCDMWAGSGLEELPNKQRLVFFVFPGVLMISVVFSSVLIVVRLISNAQKIGLDSWGYLLQTQRI